MNEPLSKKSNNSHLIKSDHSYNILLYYIFILHHKYFKTYTLKLTCCFLFNRKTSSVFSRKLFALFHLQKSFKLARYTAEGDPLKP